MRSGPKEYTLLHYVLNRALRLQLGPKWRKIAAMNQRYAGVVSSNVASVAYDAAARRLRVRFLSGSAYEYEDVGPGVARRLLRAKSVGEYFHARIRGQFDYRKLRRWRKRNQES